MRRADKLGAKKVLILGEQELETGRAPLKDMAQGTQREVDISRLAGELTPRGAE
jgi:histidyl-tRNA synthetase